MPAHLYAANEKKAKAVRLPPSYNKTRWNSRFLQLRVALRFAKALTGVVRLDQLEDKPVYGAHLDLKSDEITLLRRTTKILGWFLVLTKEVEARRPTAVDVLRLHGDLKYALQLEIAAAKKVGGTAGKFFASALQAAADKVRPYREKASQSRPLLLAAIMDPKHRLEVLKRDFPDRVEDAKAALNEEVAKVVGSSEAPKMPTTPKNRSTQIALYSRSPVAVEESAEQDEVTAYMANRFAMRDNETVLGWWKDNEVNFPILAKVARKVLATSGSTAEVERVFSAAGRFCTVRRRRLTPESLRQLVVSQQLLNAGYVPDGADVPPTPLVTPA
ncbi:unnamed protein product [Tilletia controversa]|nr:unnamed protein product [Tilletia controversa]